MLVILTEHQLLPPQIVCQTCLFADQQGFPRWQQGKLCCGSAVPEWSPQKVRQFRCEMGFRLANVEDSC
jgi:hypothetical protein